MSRINVENIRHPDAASDSLQLSDTGNITAPGNLSVTGTSTLTDDLVVDTDTLFVDVSADRVGVNSSAPSQPLTVFGSGSSGGVDFVARFGNGAAVAADNAVALLLGDASDHRAEIRATTVDANNGTLSFHTLGAGTRQERLRIGTDGSLQLRNSTGIDFSQIQTNATGMTSELLDSYEEGSWTPTFTGTSSNPTITYTQQIGNYTKIGNLVYVSCLITTSAVSGGGGNLMVSGLPFTIGESTGTGGAPAFNNLDTPGSAVVSCATELNTSQTRFFAGLLSFDNTTWANISVSALNASTSYRVAFCYRV